MEIQLVVQEQAERKIERARLGRMREEQLRWRDEATQALGAAVAAVLGKQGPPPIGVPFAVAALLPPPLAAPSRPCLRLSRSGRRRPHFSPSP